MTSSLLGADPPGLDSAENWGTVCFLVVWFCFFFLLIRKGNLLECASGQKRSVCFCSYRERFAASKWLEYINSSSFRTGNFLIQLEILI